MIGRVVGNYRIEASIGAGAVGEVYRAVHQKVERVVAIKRLKQKFAQDEHLLSRLMREQEIMDRLRHGNIVALHDVHVEEDEIFLVMEYVDGESLAEIIKRGEPLPAHKVAALGEQLLSALAATHAQGVIHRDIKPSNIMLTEHAAKLLDFGISKCVQSAELTDHNLVMGSPPYMAPETWVGEEATPATDIYSLGLCLFESLTGRRAFGEGLKLKDYLRAHTQTDLPRVRDERPDVPAWLSRAIAKATHRDPAARYADAKEMLRVFRSHTSATSMLSLADAAAMAKKAPGDAATVLMPLSGKARSGDGDRPAGTPPAGYHPGDRTMMMLLKKQRPWKYVAFAIAGSGLSVAVAIALGTFFFFRSPAVYTLDVTNVLDKSITVVCGAGSEDERTEWVVDVAAGAAEQIPIPTLPADCYHVDGDQRTLIWSIAGEVEIDEEIAAAPEISLDAQSVLADDSAEVAAVEMPMESAPPKKVKKEKRKPTRKAAKPKKAPAKTALKAVVTVGTPEHVSGEACADLIALEPRAMLGQLTPVEVACLKGAMKEDDKLTTNDKRSRLLIADAKGRNDTVGMERSLMHHLMIIGTSDPNICYAYALTQYRKGTGEGWRRTIRYANAAMDNRHLFHKTHRVSSIYQLHRLRSRASSMLWQVAETKYRESRTAELEQASDRARGQAKEFAATWYDFAEASHQDMDEPRQVCRMAVGHAKLCP